MTRPGSSLSAVLLTDMVGSTEARVRLGPEFGDVQRAHDRIVRGVLERHEPDHVEDTGDGFLACYPSIGAAVQAAIAVQWAIDDHKGSVKPDARFDIRVTLALGELRDRDDRRSGMALVEAARLEQLAGAGEVLCTGVFRTIAEEVTPGLFSTRDEVALRGMAHATEVCTLDWRKAGRFPDTLPLPSALAEDETHFVGRLAQLAWLQQRWMRQQLTVGLVLVGGEAGVGKSAVAREFARRAHGRHGWVLYGRCPPDGLTSFAPFTEAYATFREQTGTAHQLLGRHAERLDALVPSSEPGASTHGPSNLEALRYELFDAVAEWLEVVSARQRVLLVIDDLTWADQSTIDLLDHLLRTNRGDVLIVATYRNIDLEWSPAFSRLMADLTGRDAPERDSDNPGLEGRIELDGWDEEEITTTVERHMTDLALKESVPSFVRWLRTYTRGNPLFVRTVLDELVQERSVRPEGGAGLVDPESRPSVSDLLARRRDRLSVAARDLLHLAAVAGSAMNTVLDSAAAQDSDSTRGAIDELVTAGLLRRSPDRRLEFEHDIVRDAARDSLSVETQRALHLRVAEHLERGGAALHLAGELSHHLSFSDDPRQRRAATEYAVVAGDTALAALNPTLAAHHLANALRLADDAEPALSASQRCDLTRKLGQALKHDGRPEARSVLIRAARQAAELGDATAMARAALATLTDSWSDTGTADEDAVEVLSMAIERLGDRDLALRARLLAGLSAELTFAVDASRRHALSDEAVAIARDLCEQQPSAANRSVLARVLEHRHTILLDAAGLTERQKVIEELDALATDGSLYRTFNASSYGIWTALERGDTTECRARLRVMRDVAEGLGQPRLIAITRLWESTLAMVRGQVSAAVRFADESHAIYLGVGRRDALVFHVGLQYLPLWLRDRLPALIADLDECARAHPLRVGMRAGLAHARVRLGLAQGHGHLDGEAARARTDAFDAARRDLAMIDDAPVRGHQDELSTLALASMATVGLMQGMRSIDLDTVLPDEAARLERLAESLARWPSQIIFNGTACFGSTDHYQALARTAMGQFAEADALFGDAAARHSHMSAPALLALSKLEWARMLLARRDLSDGVRGRSLLEEALTMSHSLGLDWINREVHRLLAQGDRP